MNEQYWRNKNTDKFSDEISKFNTDVEKIVSNKNINMEDIN